MTTKASLTWRDTPSVAKLAGILAGAAFGALFTSFGLIDTTLGGMTIAGGNEWTPLVSGGGAVIGAVLGATAFFRRYAIAFVLAGVGMVLAILVRDEWALQPPLVFVDLFGIPAVGALIGWGLDTLRRRGLPRASWVAAMVIVPALVYWMFFLFSSGYDEEFPDCVVEGNRAVCPAVLLQRED
jgi:hypothetical protein